VGRDKSRDIVFEEKSISLPIVIASNQEQHDNVIQLPLQPQEVVPKEQTQQPQEHVSLRRSTRERRNVIPDDYIVFL
jgi:hypothetical protein